ncbi:MAG: pSer/pThr/pTyr-binding forkhead associated (FHA) protein [Kiritimatiellia bacterium]|jgi:pSer/pThr/pTyr-binding forkhead associated (FHA) protein
MNDQLTIKRDGEVLSTVELDRPFMKIGRSPDCDIALEDPGKQVSRFHAVLQKSMHEYRIKNDEGKSGTWVNRDVASDWIPLRRGDLITIGPYSLVFGFGTPDDDATIVGLPYMDALLPEVSEHTARMVADEPENAGVEVKLTFIGGPFKGGEQLIRKSRFTLGRERHNTVWLNDDTVSGVHAEIACCVGKWILRDLDSCNGVLAGKTPAGEGHRLKNGDRITLGQSVFVFSTIKHRRRRRPAPSATQLGVAVSLLFCVGVTAGMFQLNRQAQQVFTHPPTHVVMRTEIPAVEKPKPEPVKVDEESPEAKAERRQRARAVFKEVVKEAVEEAVNAREGLTGPPVRIAVPAAETVPIVEPIAETPPPVLANEAPASPEIFDPSREIVPDEIVTYKSYE